MDSNKSPDPCFVGIVNQTASTGVNTNERPDPNLIIALSETMSPTDKIDSWFASTPAGPSQPSTSHPCIRDTALPAMQTDASISGTSQVTESSHSATRDPFFDTVPKGPSQASTSRWNARLPVFTPWAPIRDQPQTSLWNRTEASISPGECPKSPLCYSKSDGLQTRSSKRFLVHCQKCRSQIHPQSVTDCEVHNRWQSIPRSHSHKLVILIPPVPLFLLRSFPILSSKVRGVKQFRKERC